MAYSGKLLENKITGQSIKFLKTAAETNGELLEIESTYQAKSKIPVSHFHPFQDEWFEVLEGEITIKKGREIVNVKKGETIHFPKNQPHAMWNNSTGKTIVNWKIKLALQTEMFFENAFGLAMDGKINKNGMPGILQVSLLTCKFSNEFRITKPPYFVQKVLFGILSPLAKLRGYKAVYEKYID